MSQHRFHRRCSRFAGPWLLLTLLAPSPAVALQPLPVFLEGARTHATRAREAVRAAEQLDASAGAATGRLLPAVTALGAYTRREYDGALPGADGRAVVITPREAWDASLGVAVPLVDVGAWDRARGERRLARGGVLDAQAALADVQREVVLAYERLIAAQARRRASERARAAAVEAVVLSRARRAAGTATALDIARAEAEEESSDRSISDEVLAGALARRALTTLSGLEPEGEVDEPVSSLDAEAPLEAWEAVALERSPALAAARARRAGSDALRMAAAHDLWPTLSASFLEQASTAPEQGHSPAFTAVAAVTWRLDVPAWMEVRVRSAAAEQATVAEERAQDEVRDAVHEAWQRVRAGIVDSRATRAQTEQATVAERLASERYAAGSGTQLELIQAQRDRVAAEAARIQADADLRYARAALRLAAGLLPNGELNDPAARIPQG